MTSQKETLLLAGGTGTFGHAFVAQALKSNKYDKIIIYSRDEFKQFYMRKKFNNDPRLRMFIGDTRDKQRLLLALSGVKYVINAAALKQVGAVQYNPFESIKTNIIGNVNIIDASIEKGVSSVMILSSDKSCMPETVYGNHKACAESYAVCANSFSGKTKIMASRYGNIQNSRGSIIEYFLRLDKNKSFPITDKNMTRFFMSIEDAVELVLFGLKNGHGGEIFLKKAKASNIEKLARSIDGSREIIYVGSEITEKLHERLIGETEFQGFCETEKVPNKRSRIVKANGNIFAVLPDRPYWDNKNHYQKYENGIFKFVCDDEITEDFKKEFISETAPKFSDLELKEMIENEKARINS